MKLCKHRYIKGYDDGSYWDRLCLECGQWPRREDVHPAAVSGWYARAYEWKCMFVENLKELRERRRQDEIIEEAIRMRRAGLPPFRGITATP